MGEMAKFITIVVIMIVGFIALGMNFYYIRKHPPKDGD